MTKAAPNLDLWLWRPVLANKVKAHHMWDGTYTLDDWADLHELLDLEQELEYQDRKRMEQGRKRPPGV